MAEQQKQNRPESKKREGKLIKPARAEPKRAFLKTHDEGQQSRTTAPPIQTMPAEKAQPELSARSRRQRQVTLLHQQTAPVVSRVPAAENAASASMEPLLLAGKSLFERQAPGAGARSLQRVPGQTGGSAAPAAAPPTPAPPASRVSELNDLLDQFDTPEDQVISLMQQMSDTDLRTLLGGDWRSRVAATLSISEMIQAVELLSVFTVADKLFWVETAALLNTSIDYDDIWLIIAFTPETELQQLHNRRWRNFFVDVCDNETMARAVDDLHMSLTNKLDWMIEEGFSTDTLFAKIRAAPVAEIAAVQANETLLQLLNNELSTAEQATLRQLLNRVALDAVQGNPTAPPRRRTSIHPTLRAGSRNAVAVQELKQKLNAAGAAPPLTVNGSFNAATRRAVRAFQRRHGLTSATSGVADRITWNKLDELGVGSTIGRVERHWDETVGGQEYGLTSRYTWRILADKIEMTVKIRFTGATGGNVITRATDAIKAIWNRYRAINRTTDTRYDVVFNPQSVASGQDRSVRLRAGNKRSNASNWYMGDPRFNRMVAHEFGHMIGLEDEYQRAHGDYVRLTGQEPSHGPTVTAAPNAARDIAQELRLALRRPTQAQRIAQTQAVITRHNLRQGDFAQSVAAAFRTRYRVNLVDYIVARIRDRDEFSLVNPFTHTNRTSIMGGMVPDEHEHPVEARHVREYVGYLRAARPGTYEIEERP